MIQSLEITNFQSHEETKLDFHPGVNIIIGNTDAGKSAIIRAMRWLIWNRPSGESMRSNWGGDTSVKLTTKKGSIVRSKDKIDKYKLAIPGYKTLVFKAFSTSIPEEISNFLNINEINLQQQLDSHFLLSKSAGEVAKYFNKIAKLDKIDTGTAYIKKEISKLTSNIAYHTDQEKSYIEELKGYEYLDKVEIQLEVLEETERRTRTLKNRREKLMDLCCSYQETDTAIRVESEILVIEEPLNKILDFIKKRNALEEKQNKLIKLTEQLQKINKNIKKQNKIISVESKLDVILGYYKELNSVNLQRDSLFKAMKNLNRIKIQLSLSEDTYNTLFVKYKKVFPNICPLCGSKVVHEH